MKKSIPISKSEAFGIFAGREDMKDSVRWVNKLRKRKIKKVDFAKLPQCHPERRACRQAGSEGSSAAPSPG